METTLAGEGGGGGGGGAAAAAKNALKSAWVNDLRGRLINAGGAGGAGGASVSLELPAPPQLGVELPKTLQDLRGFNYQQQQLDPAAAKKTAWFKSPAFIQTAIVVGVFLVVFIIMVSVQPPFLNARPNEEDNVEPKFSAGNAAWFAFASCAVCGVIFGVLAIVAARKRKQQARQLLLASSSS